MHTGKIAKFGFRKQVKTLILTDKSSSVTCLPLRPYYCLPSFEKTSFILSGIPHIFCIEPLFSIILF